MLELVKGAEGLLALGLPGMMLAIIWWLIGDRARLLKVNADLADKLLKCKDEKTDIFRQQALEAMAKVGGQT